MNSQSFQQFDTCLLTIVSWFRIETDTHNREPVKISGSSNLDQLSVPTRYVYTHVYVNSQMSKSMWVFCDAILDNGHLLGEAIPSPLIQIVITL